MISWIVVKTLIEFAELWPEDCYKFEELLVSPFQVKWYVLYQMIGQDISPPPEKPVL